MKLRYKNTLIIFINAVIVALIISVVYIRYSYNNALNSTRQVLLSYSEDVTFHIEEELLRDLNLIKTLKTAYIVKYYLHENNEIFDKLSKNEIEKKLVNLNKKWMITQDANDMFILQYTDNMLSRYLKKQKNFSPKCMVKYLLPISTELL